MSSLDMDGLDAVWSAVAMACLSLVGLRMTGPGITGIVASVISMAGINMSRFNMGGLCVRGLLAIWLDFVLSMALEEIYRINENKKKL